MVEQRRRRTLRWGGGGVGSGFAAGRGLGRGEMRGYFCGEILEGFVSDFDECVYEVWLFDG